MNKDDIRMILDEMHLLSPEELTSKAKRLFCAIMSIADERDKYKSLYENEKDHSDTLERILNKVLSSNKDMCTYYKIVEKPNHEIQPPYKVTCSNHTNPYVGTKGGHLS